MTRLSTYPNEVELANTDSLVTVHQAEDGLFEFFINYERDTYLSDRASVTFTEDEAKAYIAVLYTKFVQGVNLETSAVSL